uniref:Uncharacterized protein n=1 Tax=Rhizophora mucronata TaxID=61149 RepID=A0A2P2LAE8_RHIMU
MWFGTPRTATTGFLPTGILEAESLEKRCMTPRVSSILGFPEEKGKDCVVGAAAEEDVEVSLLESLAIIATGSRKWSSGDAPVAEAALELGDMAVGYR